MDLRVSISIEFKENLEKRFNPDSAIYDEEHKAYSIEIRCALCYEYADLKRGCGECPFRKFEDLRKKLPGCISWIEKVAGKRPSYMCIDFDSVLWSLDVDREVREWLERLRQEAEKLITWIGGKR
jgi:hypothetical protein